MRPILLVLFTALLSNCAGPINHAHQAPILVLDNMGGFSHAGRRVELMRDGVVIDTRYTDLRGDAKSSRGKYDLKGDILKLRFGDRGNQTLNRISYGGMIYWVYPGQAKELKKHQNRWLRQTSLKQQSEQMDAGNRLESGD